MTVEEYCRGILEGGSLQEKLLPPRAPDGGRLRDVPHAAVAIRAPAREGRLQLHKGGERLPPLSRLVDPEARIITLSRFAHHELMAVELFAWALLRWPELPSSLRRGLLGALEDEQRHLSLYLDRLRAHGAQLGDVPLSDYFWQHVPAIDAGGPMAFLSAMGLTLEQANLDFSLLYRDAFRSAGDEESAAVLQLVHDEEVSHVALAYTWLSRLKASEEDEVEAYRRSVPFPLSAARAKGRRFERPARRRAGLSEAFIEYVRAARPYERE